MSRPTATICKFIGTISLGLLTGVTYSTTATLLPPLHALPNAKPALHTFQRLRALVSRHQLLLASLAAPALALAYALSPPRARHPYLLWAALAVEVGYVEEIYAGVMGVVGGRKEGGSAGARTPDSSGSEEEWEVDGAGDDGGVNGEAVREGMERWRGKMVLRAGVWGVGWLVTVVGLWGDGA